MVTRFVYIALFLATLVACEKNDFIIENINNNKIDILGHGGSGIYSTYPINSMESLLNAINSDADGSEMDVQMTSDSVLVMFHDFDLSDATSLSGHVFDHSIESIRSAHYTSSIYLDLKIGEVEKLFEHVSPTSEQSFTFDVKLYHGNSNATEYYNLFARQIQKAFVDFNLYDKVIVESSNLDFIDILRNLDTSVRILFYPTDFQDGYDQAINHDLYGITISTHNITSDQIKEAHNAGLFVAIWNTHSKKDNREAVQKSPDMIQTDRLEHLTKFMK